MLEEDGLSEVTLTSTPTVIGLDPSSRRQALVILRRGRFDTKIINVPKETVDRASALNYLFQHFMVVFKEIADESDDTYLFIEAPVMGKAGIKATVVQAQAHGVIQAVALQCGVTAVYTVNNKTWKKDVIGNGNSSKDDVRSWLQEERPRLYQVCGGDRDLVDAACIGLYGQQILKRSAGLGQTVHFTR